MNKVRKISLAILIALISIFSLSNKVNAMDFVENMDLQMILDKQEGEGLEKIILQDKYYANLENTGFVVQESVSDDNGNNCKYGCIKLLHVNNLKDALGVDMINQLKTSGTNEKADESKNMFEVWFNQVIYESSEEGAKWKDDEKSASKEQISKWLESGKENILYGIYDYIWNNYKDSHSKLCRFFQAESEKECETNLRKMDKKEFDSSKKTLYKENYSDMFGSLKNYCDAKKGMIMLYDNLTGFSFYGQLMEHDSDLYRDYVNYAIYDGVSYATFPDREYIWLYLEKGCRCLSDPDESSCQYLIDRWKYFHYGDKYETSDVTGVGYEATVRDTGSSGIYEIYPAINYLNTMYAVFDAMKDQEFYVCFKNQAGEMGGEKYADISADYLTKPTIEECKKILGGGSIGIYKKKYKISSSTVKNISDNTTTFQCGWTFGSGDSSYNMQFQSIMSFSENANNGAGKITFNSFRNIKNFYPSMLISSTEMLGLLKHDTSPLKKFEEEIYASAPTLTDKEVVELVVEGIVSVALVALTVYLNSVSGGAMGAILLKTGARLTAGLAVLGIGSFVAKIAWFNFKNYAADLGLIDHEGSAWLAHGFNHKAGSRDGMSDISCTYRDNPKEFNPTIGDYEVTCKNIKEGKFGEILDYILNIMRFAAIALLAVFSVFDFVKPIVSGDAESLQKSGGKFVKRLIIAVLVFFVPALIEILLSLIGLNC